MDVASKLMATPLTPYSYYISKIVKTMAQFAIAIIVIFMIGHFYKGVTLVYKVNG